MSKHIEDDRPGLDVVNESFCDRHRKLQAKFTHQWSIYIRLFY